MEKIETPEQSEVPAAGKSFEAPKKICEPGELKLVLLGFVMGYLTASFYLLSFTMGAGATFALINTDVYTDIYFYYNTLVHLGKKCLKMTSEKSIPSLQPLHPPQ